MDPTEDALLAAICADPADNTARLVFADFLQEQGGSVETAWATFIRAHVRLVTDTATAGDIPDVCEYGNKEWLKRFVQRLGLSAADVERARFDGWERGFPSCLAGKYPELRLEWPVLLDRLPFCRLWIGGIEDEAIEDLVSWPRLERLTSLTLSTTDDADILRTVSARGVAALTACPALAGVEELNLSYLEVTDRVADLFLQSRTLTALRHLNLHGSYSHPSPSQRTIARLRARFGMNVITP